MSAIPAAAFPDSLQERHTIQEKQAKFRQQYQATTDLATFLDESPAAIDRLSRDFARQLVADVLESF